MNKIGKIMILCIILLPCLSLATSTLHKPKPSKQLQQWIKRLMKEYNIPGASIVLVEHYHIKWAKGFGLRDKKNNLPVTNETLFQAASISKPITAVAALEIFASRHISINENINNVLKSWKIPPNTYTKKNPVTLKLLLSHTAGITGFRETGYTTKDKIPTLTEILNGTSPANTPPITVVREPNTKFEYSPASYTIVQAALIDICNKPFDKIMQEIIFKPLHMDRSTFLSPLPKYYFQNIAFPYLPNGNIVPNSPYSFPTLAAGGLWSTPTDLAKFLIAIQKALAGEKQGNLTPALVMAMMKPGIGHNMGMGFEVNINKYGEAINQKGNYFRHGGFQTGYLSMLFGSKKGGNGVIIMYNSAPYMSANKVRQYDFLAKTIKHISKLEGWK